MSNLSVNDWDLGVEFDENHCASGPFPPLSRSETADSDLSSTSSTSSSTRSRYLYPVLDTVECLRPEDVRWFYRQECDKTWHSFIGYDSLRIECKFREVESRLPSVVGDDDEEEDDGERVVVRGGLFEVDVLHKTCCPIYWTNSRENSAIILRGTWFYEATWQPLPEDLATRIESEHLSQFRDHKISEEHAENTKTPPKVIHQVRVQEVVISWYSVCRVSLHQDTTSSRLYRAVGRKFGISQRGAKLWRTYHREAHMDDKPADISHLVFVVHGMGQMMGVGSIVRSCSDMQDMLRRVKKYFPGLDSDNKRMELLPVEWRSSLRLDGDTVESITPNKVKGLRQMLNSSAMDVLYYTSPLYRAEITQGLQKELNRLYTMFCARNPYFEAGGGKVSIIAHSLGCVITYDIITGWNPIQLYDQYVSSVIEEWKDESTVSCNTAEAKCKSVADAADLLLELESARRHVSELETQILELAEKQQMKSPTLKFKLENFICLGSPLAVFLALRGVRPQDDGSQDLILPQSLCARLFNLYHPSDPVAYRLEPLILKQYANIKPLRVHRSEATNKVNYDAMATLTIATEPANKSSKAKKESDEDKYNNVYLQKCKERNTKGSGIDPDKDVDDSGEMEACSDATADPEKGGWVGVFSRPSELNHLSAEMFEDAMVLEKDMSSDSFSGNGDTSVEDCNQPKLLHRLDYQLKEGKMENLYLSTLTSHTSYWTNQDVALFVLTHIFPTYGPK